MKKLTNEEVAEELESRAIIPAEDALAILNDHPEEFEKRFRGDGFTKGELKRLEKDAQAYEALVKVAKAGADVARRILTENAIKETPTDTLERMLKKERDKLYWRELDDSLSYAEEKIATGEEMKRAVENVKIFTAELSKRILAPYGK